MIGDIRFKVTTIASYNSVGTGYHTDRDDILTEMSFINEHFFTERFLSILIHGFVEYYILSYASFTAAVEQYHSSQVSFDYTPIRELWPPLLVLSNYQSDG